MDIISLIIKHREKKQLSINKLAELVGVGVSTLSRLENRETEKIDYSLVVKLKRILDIPDEDILSSMKDDHNKSKLNIELVTPNVLDSKCEVCNGSFEEDNVKELRLGNKYKTKGTNLCKNCREKLLKILSEEY